jgi:anthranilate synthase component I
MKTHYQVGFFSPVERVIIESLLFRSNKNEDCIKGFSMKKLVSTLNRDINGCFDALRSYRTLRSVRHSGPGALLETACIHSREHTQSLLMLSAALKIVCREHTVSIHALNTNGESALNILSERVPLFSRNGDALVRKYNTKTDTTELEEQKKLFDISVIEPLRQILQVMKVDQLEDDITTLLIGCFSFELFHQFEHVEFLEKDREFPDYEFHIADQLLIIDHQQGSARLIAKVFSGEAEKSIQRDYQKQLSMDKSILTESKLGNNTTSRSNYPASEGLVYTTNLSDEQYIEKVHALKKHVIAGDVFQVVLARQFSLDCYDTLMAYQLLREQNPSPYMFYIEGSDYQLLGASPESAVKVTANDNSVSIYPIAGTRSRGLTDGEIDHDLDSRMEAELRMDAKEISEHMMLVDLARNDIARISKRGTRQLERLMDVDRYSHVMHLVSKVTGDLRDEMDCFTAYRACMNMGTLTGAPKVRATQLIAQYESIERGHYGGAVGYIDACGDMDTAIVIRSAVVKEGIATVSAGAGIVFDSDPQSEADETRNKAMAVLRAIDTANQLTMTGGSLSQEVA